MLLVACDVETGHPYSVKPQDGFPVEIGLVLWDTDSHMPIELFSKIINCGKLVDPEPAALTGIDTEMVNKFGVPAESVIDEIIRIINLADYMVGHNGNYFDKPIMEKFIRDFSNEDISDKKWIDTMSDIDYPVNCKQKNLVYLTGFHHLINSFSHRAVGDAMVTLQVLDQYKLDEVLLNAKSQKFIVKAVVSYEYKDTAKAKGFVWENLYSNKYPKTWVKLVREKDLEEFKKSCLFPIEIIDTWPS